MCETGVEARVAHIVEPIITDLGYRLVRVRLTGHNGLTLQIMVERPDGTFGINDCEQVSLEISPVLDIDDPIGREYHLEVSSPGIDRPLVRKSDFERWTGHMSKVETKSMVEGRKRFKGILLQVSDDKILLKRDITREDEEETIELSIADLADARLVLNDNLVSEALKRDKALRLANDQALQSAANEN